MRGNLQFGRSVVRPCVSGLRRRERKFRLITHGSVDVSLTDGPGDFDNVYVTVRDIWFHQDAAGRAGRAGLAPLPSCGAGDSRSAYAQQRRCREPGLEGPESAHGNLPPDQAGSCADRGRASPTRHGGLNLQYNNEVQVGSSEYPLRVPAARLGIVLTGDFQSMRPPN